jgi:4-diphosphocytidyl-2-C-methyl-D-erythritol kinase
MSPSPAAPRRAASRPPPRIVRIEAHAKLNLGLAIGPRRADGFHDLATIYQSVSLADTLAVRRSAEGYRLTIAHEDAAARGGGGRARPDRVPTGAGNLVLRAARLAADRLGLPGGARFHLVKRIPSEAGLGGGSADAAAAIAGLLRLHGVRLGRNRRLALAAEVGSDVPFAMVGGTALGRGRGERLRSLRLVRPFRAVVAVPRWRVSTARAFRALDRRKYSLTAWTANLRFAQSVARDKVSVRAALRLGNSFEHALGTRRYDFESLGNRLRTSGVDEPRLTGSGSAVFGVLPEGIPFGRFVETFEGGERIYLVRSRATAMRITTIR